MSNAFANWVMTKVGNWLVKNQPYTFQACFTDFKQVCDHIQTGDVILIQGHNRVSTIISHITQSVWTHAALYVGRLQDIEDIVMRAAASQQCSGDETMQLLIESEIGIGTVITPLNQYKDDHIRLLHPQKLTHDDAQHVINFAITRLGMQYSIRQILDLARLLFPWGFFPRRWRSSLFEHNAQQPTKDICTSMIADAFQSVDYPILPLIETGYQNKIEFVRRNNRLYTPTDFDYSPYFDVIKYPYVPLETQGAYHALPWRNDVVSDDEGLKVKFLTPDILQFFSSPAYAVVGASANRNKFGNKVLRCYMQQKLQVYPVNPVEATIEGLPCFKTIAALPKNVKSISIITPPPVTNEIVKQAIQKGILNIWMQPGAESAEAILLCQQHHINVIADGRCILVELSFHEDKL